MLPFHWLSVRSLTVCLSRIVWMGYPLLAVQVAVADQPPSSRAARQLAPGVETTIPADIEPAETVSTRDVAAIVGKSELDWSPHFGAPASTLYGMAQQAKFRRTAWCLEFSFKPLRMIEVDVPAADGTTKRQLVWYLVYRVTNTGAHLASQRGPDGTYRAEPATAEEVHFVPRFLLAGHDIGVSGESLVKAYADTILPTVTAEIEARERTGQTLLTTEQISQPVVSLSDESTDQSVSGVVTWVGVDPHIDYFTIYVEGLSNSYRWIDSPVPSDGGAGGAQQFARKTLQLNFWRPGDAYGQHEAEIRFGVAPDKARLYGVPEGVAYQWVYR